MNPYREILFSQTFCRMPVFVALLAELDAHFSASQLTETQGSKCGSSVGHKIELSHPKAVVPAGGIEPTA